MAKPDSKPPFTPVAVLRAQARKHVERGPVTRSYPEDREVILEHLGRSLATEWVCVLRYLRHAYCITGVVSEPIKAHFLDHAREEQAHAHKLAERIVQLGGEPDLNPATLAERSHAEYVPATSTQDMIRENLVAERIASSSSSSATVIPRPARCWRAFSLRRKSTPTICAIFWPDRTGRPRTCRPLQ